MILSRHHPSCTLELRFRAFIWGIVCFFTKVKGQQISKANWGVLDSSKKRTKLTILSTFSTQDSELHSFFGRIEDTIFFFEIYWPDWVYHRTSFRNILDQIWTAKKDKITEISDNQLTRGSLAEIGGLQYKQRWNCLHHWLLRRHYKSHVCSD